MGPIACVIQAAAQPFAGQARSYKRQIALGL